jgi:hypothetical protein
MPRLGYLIYSICFGLAASQLNCTQLKCSSVKGSQCYSYDPSSKSATVSPCSKDTACNYNPDSPSNSICQQKPASLISSIQSLPGAKCSSTKCIDSSGVTCSDGTCKGISLEAPCNSTNQCNPGLYCKYDNEASSCQPLLKKGEACSPSDYCTYGYGCNFGFCVNLFSIQSGMEVDRYTCFQGVSPICQSHACYENEDQYVYCINPYVDVARYNKPCSKCTGVSNTGALSFNLTLDCQCGLSGSSYCPGFNGSKHARKLSSLYQDFLMSGFASKCNIESYLDCILSYGGERMAWEIIYYSYLVQYEAKLFGAKDCVVETLMPEFHMAEVKVDENEVEQDIGYLSAFVLALFALFRSLFG